MTISDLIYLNIQISKLTIHERYGVINHLITILRHFLLHLSVCLARVLFSFLCWGRISCRIWNRFGLAAGCRVLSFWVLTWVWPVWYHLGILVMVVWIFWMLRLEGLQGLYTRIRILGFLGGQLLRELFYFCFLRWLQVFQARWVHFFWWHSWFFQLFFSKTFELFIDSS